MLQTTWIKHRRPVAILKFTISKYLIGHSRPRVLTRIYQKKKNIDLTANLEEARSEAAFYEKLYKIRGESLQRLSAEKKYLLHEVKGLQAKDK